MSAEIFQSAFETTFKQVLPRYFESQAKIGISLTGGLDTRMIVACRPDGVRDIVCYTFSGESDQTFDDRLAAQVAKISGLEHRLLRIDSDFFSEFAAHVDRTVCLTDGCFGVTGAHEVYFNKKARQLAPVRLTGNYGSEVLRGTSTFKPLGLSPALFNPEFRHCLDSAADSRANENIHPITFAAFCEIPWNLFGSAAASRSQVTFRTPYLDNELIALAYQAPPTLRKSPLPAWRLVNANHALLGRIPTDRRPSPKSSNAVAILRRFYSEATFKLDYLNNEGWPNWLSPFDSVFAGVASSLKIVGLHKYLHYRRWFRSELAEYVRESLSDRAVQEMGLWDPKFIRNMADAHIRGYRNYTAEINAVLTLASVQRLLFRGLPSSIDSGLEITANRDVARELWTSG